jgi:hypothetical protein
MTGVPPKTRQELLEIEHEYFWFDYIISAIDLIKEPKPPQQGSSSPAQHVRSSRTHPPGVCGHSRTDLTKCAVIFLAGVGMCGHPALGGSGCAVK